MDSAKSSVSPLSSPPSTSSRARTQPASSLPDAPSSSLSPWPQPSSPSPPRNRPWGPRRALPPPPLKLIPPPTPRLGATLSLPSPTVRKAPISAPPVALSFPRDGRFLKSPWAKPIDSKTVHNTRRSIDSAVAVKSWTSTNVCSATASPVLTASSFDSQDIESEIEAATVATEMALQVLRSEGSSLLGPDAPSGSSSDDANEEQLVAMYKAQGMWPKTVGFQLKPPSPSMDAIWDHERGEQDTTGSSLLRGQLFHGGIQAQGQVGPEGEPKRKGRARMSQEKRRRLARRKEREALMAMGMGMIDQNYGHNQGHGHSHGHGGYGSFSGSASPTASRRMSGLSHSQNYQHLAQQPRQHQYSIESQSHHHQAQSNPTSPSNYFRPLPPVSGSDNALGLDLTAMARKQMASAVVRGHHFSYGPAMHPVETYYPSLPGPGMDAPSSRWWTARDIAAVSPSASASMGLSPTRTSRDTIATQQQYQHYQLANSFDPRYPPLPTTPRSYAASAFSAAASPPVPFHTYASMALAPDSSAAFHAAAVQQQQTGPVPSTTTRSLATTSAWRGTAAPRGLSIDLTGQAPPAATAGYVHI